MPYQSTLLRTVYNEKKRLAMLISGFLIYIYISQTEYYFSMLGPSTDVCINRLEDLHEQFRIVVA